MAPTRSVWRSLRPVLLAAVAATSWMAFSASAATADSSFETDSLLKDVGPSVTMLTTTATDRTGDILPPAPNEAPRNAGAGPAAAAASSTSALALGPVTHAVIRSTDGLLQSVAVVTDLVPAESLTEVADPVVNIADSVVRGAAEGILPQAGTVLGVLDPALEPIIDLGVMTGAPAVPDITLGVPVLDGADKDSSRVTADGLVAAGADGAALLASDPAVIASVPGTDGFASSAPCGDQQPSLYSPSVSQPPYPDGDPLDVMPDVIPAMPGSGSAGVNGPGAGPATPAWLAAHHFEIPPAAALPILGALLSSPSPVSFDPGSSPD